MSVMLKIETTTDLRRVLLDGIAIPAHPLVLNAQRQLDERRQRGLSRYYLAAGAGGLAVGVHTTQFAIHDPDVGLYRDVLQLAAEEVSKHDDPSIVKVAGILGKTEQAVREAELAGELGYHAGLLSLTAMRGHSEAELLSHCRAVADALPVFGFYLQEGVGGLTLPYSFWKQFVEIPNVVAIKIAAFDRYKTIDVVRALAESERDDIALYTGNDDNILQDLLTTYRFNVGGRMVEKRFSGGLLGHWAVWTKRSVELLMQAKRARASGTISEELMVLNNEITDANAVLFDAANNFRGCIPGLLDVLRRQGLVEGTWCLDENETLSPGQSEEIDRLYACYPHLTDDDFVSAHRASWLDDTFPV